MITAALCRMQALSTTECRRSPDTRTPEPVLHFHHTGHRHTGAADPSAPGGTAAIHRHLVADDARTDFAAPAVRL